MATAGAGDAGIGATGVHRRRRLHQAPQANGPMGRGMGVTGDYLLRVEEIGPATR